VASEETSILTPAFKVFLVAAILLLLGFYFHFAASSHDAGFHFSDSVRYLFMADAFSGASDELTLLIARSSVYPPLFPLLLGVLGAGTDSIALAHVLTIATLALACAACFWWLTEEQLTVNERLAVVLVVLLLPGTFLHSMVIASEYLFLALILSALAAFRKTGPGGTWILVAAMLVGLSILTRTIGIALLPVLVLAGLRLGYRKLAYALLVSLCPYLLWRLFREGGGATAGYLELLFVFLQKNSLTEIAHYVVAQLQYMFGFWVRIFDRWSSAHVVLIQVFLLVPAGAVFLHRLCRLKADSVFLLCYLGIIVIWPFPHSLERFTVILVPIFLFYCILAVKVVSEKLDISALNGLLKTSVLVLLIVSSMPTLLFWYNRFSLPVEPQISGQKFSQAWYWDLDTNRTIFTAGKIDRIYRLLEAIDDHVAAEECVYTTMVDMVALYSKRKAKILPVDMYRNAESGYGYDFSQLTECNYILFLSVSVVQVPQFVAMYPIQAAKPHVNPILLSEMTHEGKEITVAALAEIVK
jgi:hypothetical protein